MMPLGQLGIRHALEDKIRELGGKIKGAGAMMVLPFTMDFNFEMEGRNFSVKLVDIEDLQKYRELEEKSENNPDEHNPGTEKVDAGISDNIFE
jgi:hypothetical protein